MSVVVTWRCLWHGQDMQSHQAPAGSSRVGVSRPTCSSMATLAAPSGCSRCWQVAAVPKDGVPLRDHVSYPAWDFRIIESFRSEKTSSPTTRRPKTRCLFQLEKTSSPTVTLALSSLPLIPVPKHHFYMSFEYLQGW